MEEAPQLIGGFKKRFFKLVAQFKQLVVENEQLKVENEKLKTDLDYMMSKVEKLEEYKKREELKVAFIASDHDAKKAKQNISKIVREIDNCIALLNR